MKIPAGSQILDRVRTGRGPFSSEIGSKSILGDCIEKTTLLPDMLGLKD
jgi:hypothetical protein